MLEFRHICAMIWYDLKVDPDTLIIDNGDGTLNFDKFDLAWKTVNWMRKWQTADGREQAADLSRGKYYETLQPPTH